ncbi:MAG: DUF899 family protein [Alphaproteobacteria bacterium]|nr:DUF899 family protein [Alphaproteobacteria bacterium]
MKYMDAKGKLNAYRQQISEIRGAMRKVQTEIEPQEVSDYIFKTRDGKVALSSLFGEKDDLFVIHNMGASCAYCTLWADGYNGAYDHLASRAAFVISSPDTPETQKEFAQKRGWRFPMVSHQGSSFAADMGYRSESGAFTPGVSVFQRKRRKIYRVADTLFNDYDEFCPVWHLLDLLPEGANGWQPKFTY